jgi:predicted extracellular nuclease
MNQYHRTLRFPSLLTVSCLLISAFCCSPLTVLAQKERLINAVQSDKNVSPFEGQTAQLNGIVTARLKSGFFIQTPDDKTDNNPATSEGIYVFTGSEPTSDATVGNLVTVTGFVTEFRPKAEPASLPLTELSMKKGTDTIKVVSKGSALPKPIVLTAADFAPNQIDELEKYEGMRVEISALTVVAPTRGRVNDKNAASVSDGVFYAVLKGMARPFRAPGMDVYDYYFSKDKDELKKNFPKLLVFDSNPETLRVDSDEQLGAQTIEVTSGAEIKNLVGVMHYGYQKYTILPDAGLKPEISGLIKSEPLPAPTERQFAIVGMNLENFFDDQDDPSIKEDIVTTEAFEKRLKKISTAIRLYMRNPDVIGAVEAENPAALKRLAQKINDDTVADGKPNPKYEAYLIEGNDGRGIDVGFLVKSSRVNVVEVKQFGKDDQYRNPEKKENEILNDRPPLLLKATINDPKNNQPFGFTVVVNHLKSFLGYETDRVRQKKKAQAEFLAKFVQERQKADPNERIVLVGDFNAFHFPDGVLDVIGTIKGTPAPKGRVLIASDDLVNTNLTNLVDLIKEEQRFSYVYDGNAQVLDHMIVTEAMKKHLAGFGYSRLNADFPESYRGDANRVERFSDHDPAIGYFSFDEKSTATTVKQ